MDKLKFLESKQYPQEWLTWELFPDELFLGQLDHGGAEDDDAPEHWRHGAFQWWLRRAPDADTLCKLARLSWLDPDEPMAGYVRQCIAAQAECNDDVRRALEHSSAATGTGIQK